jgi:hypothetical protein
MTFPWGVKTTDLFVSYLEDSVQSLLTPNIDRSQSPPQDLRTVRTAAVLAQVHVKTIYRWATAGKVQLYGHPGAYRVPMSQVLPIAQPKRKKRTASPDERAGAPAQQAADTVSCTDGESIS